MFSFHPCCKRCVLTEGQEAREGNGRELSFNGRGTEPDRMCAPRGCHRTDVIHRCNGLETPFITINQSAVCGQKDESVNLCESAQVTRNPSHRDVPGCQALGPCKSKTRGRRGKADASALACSMVLYDTVAVMVLLPAGCSLSVKGVTREKRAGSTGSR